MSANGLPTVSVIIPARNEEAFIEACVESMLASDYPSELLEILVVDGASVDRTRALVENYARQHSAVRIVDNPQRITPAAVNRGIAASTGDVVLRADAHASYPPHYIRVLVDALDRFHADVAGSVMVTKPRENTLIGAAIVGGMSHPFGVGNSYFRTGSREPRIVDTLFGGAYRRTILEKVGRFNERLPFSQDIEYNLRVRHAGGRVLLVPEVSCEYYARSDLGSFSRHNFRNGVWVILPFLYSSIMPVAWKHLVPLAFVLALAGTGTLAFFVPRVGIPTLAGLTVTYLLSSFVAGVGIARRTRRASVAVLMPFVFADLHVLYGLGSLVGLFKAAWIGLKRRGAHRASVSRPRTERS